MKNEFLVPALRVTSLSKKFTRLAVDNLDLTIQQGEFYALLGKNGAGKTTLLRMVTGLLAVDTGGINIFGFDLFTQASAAKQMVAYLPDEPMLYSKLTPLEYLEFIAALWRTDSNIAATKARELLDCLELSNHAYDLIENFSRGMKQKVALAGALIHNPKLIILDEPLTGLDVSAGRIVKDLLLQHVRDGGTVILTTHILEVAEYLASRIGIIQNGKLLVEGTLEELRKKSGSSETLENLFLQLTETPLV